MAETIIILGDWNSDTPAAPAGRSNVLFAVDRTGDIPKFSASVEAIPATFLIGIGAAISAADDVAPVYRVKRAGIVTKFAAKAKTGLADDAVFMIKRNRSGTLVSILTANLTIPDGDTDWFETDAFDNDDLELNDELQLNVISGNPKDVTLELHWS